MKRSTSSSAPVKSPSRKHRTSPVVPRARPKSKAASAKPVRKSAAPSGKLRAEAETRSDGDPPLSKQLQLISMLRSASGASMAQLTSATGWQAHTVRGAISGSLRKRLHLTVQCQSEEGIRIYRIVESSAP